MDASEIELYSRETQPSEKKNKNGPGRVNCGQTVYSSLAMASTKTGNCITKISRCLGLGWIDCSLTWYDLLLFWGNNDLDVHWTSKDLYDF